MHELANENDEDDALGGAPSDFPRMVSTCWTHGRDTSPHSLPTPFPPMEGCQDLPVFQDLIQDNLLQHGG